MWSYWYILLWLAACVYMFCMTVSVAMVDILMFHFVVLVMIDEHAFQEQVFIKWYKRSKMHNHFPCWKRVSLTKFSVLERQNIDQKMYLSKRKKSTTVVLMCCAWQILNNSYHSQCQNFHGIKNFFFSSSINVYNNSENTSGAKS